MHDLLAPARAGAARGELMRGPVVLATNQFPKASETFIVKQLLGLLDLGWDVHVVCPSSDPVQRSFFPELEAAPDIAKRIHVTRDLMSVLTALKARLVHYEFGAVAPNTIRSVHEFGCRTLVSFRGYDLNDARFSAPGHYDDVWTYADVIHLVSQHMWRRAQDRGCPARKQHRVIYDAADTAYFDPGEREYVRDIGMPERPLRLLSIGRLHWKKGYEYALEAMRLLERRNIAFEYRIIGDGEHREAVEYTIEDTGLQGSVQLVGAQPLHAVRAALAWADVLVHAAVTEGFCVAALEAQAMGVPVVCTDAGGLPENVVDGLTGFIVPRRDAAALADCLSMIVRMPFAREQLGPAGRRRVVQLFGSARQIAAFGELYAELLREPVETAAPAAQPEDTLDARVSRIETALAAAEWMVRAR